MYHKRALLRSQVSILAIQMADQILAIVLAYNKRSIPPGAMVAAVNDFDRDLRTLARFIQVYCRHKHLGEPKRIVELKGFDLRAIAGTSLSLCRECEKLLAHAFVKRSRCPMEPKPACKHCPNHCYHPKYRAAIRDVMKYSGRQLLLTGRLDYLFHLLY